MGNALFLLTFLVLRSKIFILKAPKIA